MTACGFAKNEKVAWFKVKEKIGRGGFARVYRAIDTRLRRDVAIKLFDPPSETDYDEMRERFIDEAKKLAKCKNPHIVTVHHIGRVPDPERLYFVMEYMPHSLDTFLCDYEYEESARILKQTLQGLAVIHEKGWTHRDVKPPNILLTESDDAKLADFGIVKDPAKDITAAHARMGTHGWMAPEQQQGRQVTPRSDVYSFGLVAYTMFTGGDPDDIDLHWLEDWTNKKLADLLGRCLMEDPSDRPTNAKEILHEWTRIEKSMRSMDKPRRRRVRGDAKVSTVVSRIEEEYGLPQGSVSLKYPPTINRRLYRNVKISKLRREWEG